MNEILKELDLDRWTWEIPRSTPGPYVAEHIPKPLILDWLKKWCKYLNHPFFKFYVAMIDIYLENESAKGDSWKDLSWAYLMDNLSKQFEDMQIDPDREDYFSNIGNYSAMLWLTESARLGENKK